MNTETENNSFTKPTPESLFGGLLSFTSRIAIAIRMNSDYNPESEGNSERGRSVMWLSDSIHNLNGLAHAMESGYRHSIAHEAERQAEYLKRHHSEIEQAIRASSYGGSVTVDIQEGIGTLEKIADFYKSKSPSTLGYWEKKAEHFARIKPDYVQTHQQFGVWMCETSGLTAMEVGSISATAVLRGLIQDNL